METPTLREGVDVFGSDGKKLGKVGHLFSAAPTPAAKEEDTGDEPFVEEAVATGTDRDPMAEVTEMPAAYGATRVAASGSGNMAAAGIAPIVGDEPAREPAAGVEGGGVTLGPSETKYFEVHHGGLLGLGGEKLYVPYDAINVVEADGSVTLKCASDEAASLYSQQPPALDAGS